MNQMRVLRERKKTEILKMIEKRMNKRKEK